MSTSYSESSTLTMQISPRADRMIWHKNPDKIAKSSLLSHSGICTRLTSLPATASSLSLTHRSASSWTSRALQWPKSSSFQTIPKTYSSSGKERICFSKEMKSPKFSSIWAIWTWNSTSRRSTKLVISEAYTLTAQLTSLSPKALSYTDSLRKCMRLHLANRSKSLIQPSLTSTLSRKAPWAARTP